MQFKTRCMLEFASEVMTSSSIVKWIMPQLLCSSSPLVFCCDQFDPGSRQVKHDPVDLVTEGYDITLFVFVVTLHV